MLPRQTRGGELAKFIVRPRILAKTDTFNMNASVCAEFYENLKPISVLVLCPQPWSVLVVIPSQFNFSNVFQIAVNIITFPLSVLEVTFSKDTTHYNYQSTKRLYVTNKAVWRFALLVCIRELFGPTVGSQTNYFSEHLSQFSLVATRIPVIVSPTNTLPLLSI